jgi:hypothetical protein
VEVDDDILGLVADDDEEASLLFLDAIADERRNARVSVRSKIRHGRTTYETRDKLTRLY